MKVSKFQRLFSVFFYLFLCLAPVSASGSESRVVTEDEMVVTATMTEKEMQKAPGAVEVISRPWMLAYIPAIRMGGAGKSPGAH